MDRFACMCDRGRSERERWREREGERKAGWEGERGHLNRMYNQAAALVM